MSDSPLSFADHHKKLEQTVIGYSAFSSSGHFVVRGSVEAVKSWFLLNEPDSLQSELQIEPFTYDSLARFAHEEAAPFLLDSEAMAQFRKTTATDECFRPTLKETEYSDGTLIEPVYNIHKGRVAVLQMEVDQYIVGFALLKPDNYLLTEDNGLVLAFDEESAARAKAQETGATVFPLTSDAYFRHRDEGYRFAPNAIIAGRCKDLEGWQRICDFFAAKERLDESL
jgi:hypothetical protein